MHKSALIFFLLESLLLMQLVNCAIIRIETQPESTVKKSDPSSCRNASWDSQKVSELEGIWKADSSKCPPPPIGPYDEIWPRMEFSNDCHWGDYKIDFARHDVTISGISIWTKNERIKWEGKGNWHVDKNNIYLCIDWIKSYYRQKADSTIDTIFQRDTSNQNYSCFNYRIHNESKLDLTAQGKTVFFTNVNK
jgi:hypothetical protein